MIGSDAFLQELQAAWPDFEIRRRARVFGYDVFHKGLGIPFGSVIHESECEWRWMTPAWGYPGREPQAPPGHRNRYGGRREGVESTAAAAAAKLIAWDTHGETG